MALSVMHHSTPLQSPSVLDRDMVMSQTITKGVISIPTSNAWACGPDGQCELFSHMDVNRIQTIALEPTYRLFRYIQSQPAGRPDHIITWGESRGSGIVVWSTYAATAVHPRSSTPARRKNRMRFLVPRIGNINISLRGRVARSLDAVSSGAPKRLRSLGYVRVRKMREDLNEVMWHIVREQNPIELGPSCAEA